MDGDARLLDRRHRPGRRQPPLAETMTMNDRRRREHIARLETRQLNRRRRSDQAGGETAWPKRLHARADCQLAVASGVFKNPSALLPGKRPKTAAVKIEKCCVQKL